MAWPDRSNGTAWPDYMELTNCSTRTTPPQKRIAVLPSALLGEGAGVGAGMAAGCGIWMSFWSMNGPRGVGAVYTNAEAPLEQKQQPGPPL